MKAQPVRWSTVAALAVVSICATWTIAARAGQKPASDPPAARPAATGSAVMPQYDAGGALRLPHDYRRWIMIGGSLGISYSDMPGDHEMFAHTLMEPTAYDAFVQTGKFREGTMLALVLQGKAEKVLPARRGQFASDVHGVEMAVKDSSHSPDGWSYYGFGGMGSIATTAKAEPKARCYSCHAEHAARDHVFLQFYPLLSEASAGAKGR